MSKSTASYLPFVEIFTDGSCLKNPGGAGGWGVLLRFGSVEKELSGYDPSTTNNRMELMAAIQGLEALKKPCHVRLMSDSQYVIKGASIWIKGWLKNDWKHKQKKVGWVDILNKALWQRLHGASVQHKIEWVWVRGHNGHIENERVDKLAGEAARRGAGKQKTKACPVITASTWEAALARPHNVKPVFATQRELDIGKTLKVQTPLRNKLYSLPNRRGKHG